MSSAATAMAAIDLRGIHHRFGEVVALTDVDFTINRHERLGIVGPSGCGKSTLLSAIAGLIQPDEGTIAIDEATTADERLRRCALMPQRDLLLPWRTAIDNAAIALENRGMNRAQARERTRPLFERFGLAEFEERMPAQLSGGMRQRVAFLRTLMAEKDILLLDEPFAALDSITRSGMQEWLLSALEQEPRTVLLVTHDVDEAILLTHRVIVMSARPGRIVRTLETDLPRDRPRREVVTSPGFARGARVMNERTDLNVTPSAARTRNLLGRLGPPALVVVLTIALWELIIRVFDVPTYIWSSPSLIAETVQERFSELLTHSGVTLVETLVGFFVAVVVGLAFGLLLHFSVLAKRSLYPLLIASQSIPTVVLAPVFVLVLGFGLWPKVAVVALFCFFPIVVSTIDGLTGVDREYIRMMLTLDATRMGIFRRVEFPSALPQIFTGTRVAATYAAIGAVFGEWAGSQAGLGWQMLQAKGRLDTALVFADIVFITIMALGLFGVVSLVERLTIPWARKGGVA